MSEIPTGISRPLFSPDKPGGGPEEKKDVFKPSFLFKKDEDLDKAKKELNNFPKFSKMILLMHSAADSYTPSSLSNTINSLLNYAAEEGVPEESYGYIQGLISDRIMELGKRGPAYRELPLHIGAVFDQGREYQLVEHESIPILDVKDQDHQNVFILENLHAFNERFKNPGAWEPAVNIWIADFQFAAQAENFTFVQERKCIEQIKAAMAVTASSRAMEMSTGSPEAYGVWLTAGGQGKETNLDSQDLDTDLILHKDPGKLDRLLNPKYKEENWLIKRYFDRIIEEMGIQNTPELYWQEEKGKDLEEDEEGYWSRNSNGLKLSKPIEEIRRDRRDKEHLLYYLVQSAKNGGFNRYIEDVLLGKDSEDEKKEWQEKGYGKDSRWAAARLASDIILTDGIYTRWDFQITNGREGEGAIRKNILDDRNLTDEQKKEKKYLWKTLKLFPSKKWGGDPLRALLQPSFLPDVIKGVYQGPEGKPILDLIDKSFSMKDVLSSLNTKDEKGKEVNKLVALKEEIKEEDYALPVSMAGDLKSLIRHFRAHWTFLAASRGNGIPQWTKDTEKELLEMADLLDTVYGRKTTEDGFPTGKHIVGAMMSRIIHCKALAFVMESKSPEFFDKIKYFIGGDEAHPYFEVMKMLWGPDLDAKSGLRQQLSAGRTQLIFHGNVFGAVNDLLEARNILESNEQREEPREREEKRRATGRFVGTVLNIWGGGKRR